VPGLFPSKNTREPETLFHSFSFDSLRLRGPGNVIGTNHSSLSPTLFYLSPFSVCCCFYIEQRDVVGSSDGPLSVFSTLYFFPPYSVGAHPRRSDPWFHFISRGFGGFIFFYKLAFSAPVPCLLKESWWELFVVRVDALLFRGCNAVVPVFWVFDFRHTRILQLHL